MTITSDIDFNSNINTDNAVLVAAAFNIKKGQFIGRDDIREIAHNKSQVIPHPTIPGLIKGGENNIMTKGRIRIVYKLDEDITEEEIKNYIQYVEADLVNSKAIYVEAAHELHVFYTAVYTQKTFKEFPVKYQPIANKATMLFSEGSDLFCCLRIDGEPESWTVEYRDSAESSDSFPRKITEFSPMLPPTNPIWPGNAGVAPLRTTQRLSPKCCSCHAKLW